MRKRNDKRSRNNQKTIHGYLVESFSSWRRLLPLFGFAMLVAIGAVLDGLRIDSWGIFGVTGCGGIAIYAGIVLLVTLKQDRSDNLMYKILAAVMIVLGSVAIFDFFISWLLLR